MEILFENKIFKACAVNCVIDSIGVFRPAAANDLSRCAGNYSYIRLKIGNELKLIERVRTYNNCEPEIKAGNAVSIVYIECSTDSTVTILAIKHNSTICLDIDTYYYGLDVGTKALKKITKLGYATSIFFVLIAIPAMFVIIPGIISLIIAWIIFRKMKKINSLMVDGINALPAKSQLEKYIHAYFSSTVSVTPKELMAS